MSFSVLKQHMLVQVINHHLKRCITIDNASVTAQELLKCCTDNGTTP
jgi:hypothetical protein